MISTLVLNQLELFVHLGWTDDERQKKQKILTDIELIFSTPPVACATDKLNDTVCYNELIQTLQNYLSEKKFHLIEYLCRDIFLFLQTQLAAQTKIKVTITKYPAIAGLTGGVRFSYGDHT